MVDRAPPRDIGRTIMITFADLELTDVRPLTGGVSGATVVRARWSDRDVVVKRTSRSELVALRLFAELGEPLLPRLLASGTDEAGPWVVIPFHHGQPVDIMAELPDPVHRCLGRLHARFAGNTARLGDDLEVIDSAFLERALTEFGPEQLGRARSVLGPASYARASRLLDRLAGDTRFRAAVEQFTPTVVHGDLYGLNVLQPAGPESEPLIIDWNAARVGPAMFDVAMTSDYDSPARRAHDRGWAEIAGSPPDPDENAQAHAWSSALINAMYAGTVAIRSSGPDAVGMIVKAEVAVCTFHRLARS
ncbi:MAG: aminoglycoside phosphotransferase family protein [Microlunatus sp.]|nr:aminoglycoside phosphotransferase family protein [Microlunatus sp.]